MLWDEPFNGLDDALKGEIFQALKLYWKEKGQTVVIVTHDQHFAQQLDHVVHLEAYPS